MMNIEFKKSDSTLNAAVEGRIDTTTSVEFLTALQENLEGITKVVVDFSKVDFVSSACIRALLTIRNTLAPVGGNVIIRNVSPDVRTIFDVTRVDELITVE